MHGGCASICHLLNVCKIRRYIVHVQLKQSQLHDWMLSQVDNESLGSVCFAVQEWQD